MEEKELGGLQPTADLQPEALGLDSEKGTQTKEAQSLLPDRSVEPGELAGIQEGPSVGGGTPEVSVGRGQAKNVAFNSGNDPGDAGFWLKIFLGREDKRGKGGNKDA